MSESHEMRWTISARPICGQPIERCLPVDAVEESSILTSHTGVLQVRLRPGITREAAIGIVECLRSLPGEPLTVDLGQLDEDGNLWDELG